MSLVLFVSLRVWMKRTYIAVRVAALESVLEKPHSVPRHYIITRGNRYYNNITITKTKTKSKTTRQPLLNDNNNNVKTTTETET